MTRWRRIFWKKRGPFEEFRHLPIFNEWMIFVGQWGEPPGANNKYFAKDSTFEPVWDLAKSVS